MRRLVVFALIAAGVAYSATGTAHAATTKLIAGDVGFDFFGTAVATTGSTAIIGAPEDTRGTIENAGAAYVYTNSGGAWTQQAKLVASDAGPTDFFGFSVSVAGDTAVIGAYRDDNARGMNAGAAYVYARSGSVWSQQAKLVASDGAIEDRFGMSVAVNGNTVLVGAPQHNAGSIDDAGAAYVFTRSGSTWTQQAKLAASDPGGFDRNGISVGLSGDTAIVGSYQDDVAGAGDSGSAYVFVRSGTTWTQQAKLVASDAASFDLFGVSVAVSVGTALVGAYSDDHSGRSNAGSAYVFVRSGTTWTQQEKLSAFDAEGADLFGASVAFEAETALIGSRRDDHSGLVDAGSVYAFVRSGSSWTLQKKFLAPDAAEGDNLGAAVAFAGGLGVVGAPSADHSGFTGAGSAYVFDGIGSVNAPPDTTITGSPPTVTGPNASFTFSGTDDMTPAGSLTFWCALDASGFAPCTSPRSYSNLAAGNHLFRVAARDGEGNFDPTPAEVGWTVDRTGPTTTFTTANNAVLINIGGVAPIEVTGRANDDAAGVEAVTVTYTPLDLGDAYTADATLACSLPVTTSCTWHIAPPRSLGRWELRASARDVLGNVGPSAGPITVIAIAVAG